jgi:hypothetical protein
VTEGAGRRLICDRLDISGSRWGPDGAEAILKLRAVRSSGDFDEYWRPHEQVAYVRNHLERYEAGHPATMPPETPRPRRHLTLVKCANFTWPKQLHPRHFIVVRQKDWFPVLVTIAVYLKTRSQVHDVCWFLTLQVILQPAFAKSGT